VAGLSPAVDWGQSARAGSFPWHCGFDGTVPAGGFRGLVLRSRSRPPAINSNRNRLALRPTPR